MNTEEKYQLITRNLKETLLDPTIIKKILDARPLRVYWGTSCTGKIHIGYVVQMLKIIDYLNAGCEVTILIADLHAVLDNMKSTFETVTLRSEYYMIMIQELLKSLGADLTNLKFVKGSEFQLKPEYTHDMFKKMNIENVRCSFFPGGIKAHTLISLTEAKHAGAEVVKQSVHPKMAGLMYPTLQALDEQYLNCDVQSGGVDQRKIFIHARNLMPKLGYKNRGYLMTPMISGLRFEKTMAPPVMDLTTEKQRIKDVIAQLVTNNDESVQSFCDRIRAQLLDDSNIQDSKMSSSNPDSKIDLLDSRNILQKKINRAYCLPGNIDDNCLLELLRDVIFPVLNVRNIGFTIQRKHEYGGVITYSTIDDVYEDYRTEKLYPKDLKLGLVDALDSIISPLRMAFETKERKELLRKAYPL